MNVRATTPFFRVAVELPPAPAVVWHMKKVPCPPQPSASSGYSGYQDYVAPTSVPPPIFLGPDGLPTVPSAGGQFQRNIARLLEMDLNDSGLGNVAAVMNRASAPPT